MFLVRRAAEKFIQELYTRYHAEGPALAAAAAAARALAPTSSDPAEPCLPSLNPETASEPGSPQHHRHHAAIGNSMELVLAPPDR